MKNNKKKGKKKEEILLLRQAWLPMGQIMGEEMRPLQRKRTEHFVHWKNECCLSPSGFPMIELVWGRAGD